MLPLKNIPKMLRNGSSSSAKSRITNGHAVSPLRNGDKLETASQTSEGSTMVPALETEETELDRLVRILTDSRERLAYLRICVVRVFVRGCKV